MFSRFGKPKRVLVALGTVVTSAAVILGAGNDLAKWGKERLGIEHQIIFSVGVTEVPEAFSYATPPLSAEQYSKLGTAPDCPTLGERAISLGATDIGAAKKSFTLEGGTDRGVTISDIHAKIQTRTKPLAGAYIECASGGGVEGIPLGFNLDDPIPVARDPRTNQPYFTSGNTIDLSQSETQGFEVAGESSKSYIEWTLEVVYVVDGERRTLELDDKGKPFRVTGSSENENGGGYRRYFRRGVACPTLGCRVEAPAGQE